ncbi:voltage-dependent calcium channel subunit alpha-2/delta-3 isoform X2 [Thrips palmi]|uniref:Voltage-dependent calcium channel subunit alpha-2/delta-3 isoform X2 n=1 Tax=Thrips palmi TaxID=161013 RepID=A0A6P8Y982_THRPL|nr:voltage-dependent calcium channel subunit alpha-2/delta-3 isoform X2 [Thrips palmi]
MTVLALLLVLCLAARPAQPQDDEQVTKWARELGDELWELGRQICKPDEIKREYSRHNARTEIKTGDAMLNDIVGNMERMLQQKMDAVQCIMERAEESAQNFEYDDSRYWLYHSAKASPVYFNGEPLDANMKRKEEEEEEDESLLTEAERYRKKALAEEEEQSKHKVLRFDWDNLTEPEYLDLWLEERQPLFYGIPINLTHSSVHVPDNVFDHGPHVQAGLQWSEDLNEVFRNNYGADPSLSWQYFGHSTGFMRIFPALHWVTRKEEDVEDEKDVVVDVLNLPAGDDPNAGNSAATPPNPDATAAAGDAVKPVAPLLEEEEDEEEDRMPDLYDCRRREWYIEAATCTKDVVILVDNTGSMWGVRKAIAHLTVRELLATFGANDFVSVISYNDTAMSVVECFEGTLVQGTPEYKEALSKALDTLKPEEYANLTHALLYAMDLLDSFRSSQNCPDLHCNQAIMLVTDGIAFNMTDFMLRYNRDENGMAPVRIFTFLLGREVTRVLEIMEMACLNRGYYSHVQSMNEAREDVLKYIPVVARPLVLQEVDHPIRWTPLFADTSDPKMDVWLYNVMHHEEQRTRLDTHEKNSQLYYSERKQDNKYIQDEVQDKEYDPIVHRFREYRMMTSVSVPAFDRKLSHEYSNETEVRAELLGIAGIDVPILDFVKLTMPHSIGVNGYVFIVTNNGYILTHPDHRPVLKGILKTNYNSVDLSEVEFADEEREPRDPSPDILELREAMVNHSRAHMQIRIKFHFDEMRRVDSELKDVYIAPLNGTPFSIAMVLPTEYGHAWLKVASDEFKKYRQAGSDPTLFFDSTRWKIHPEWDYCAYFHEDYRVFASPEARVLHFVERASHKNWEWRERFRAPPPDAQGRCARPQLDQSDYYCDRELMQLLVFDARLSQPYFKGSKWEPKTRDEQDLARKYNVSLRFISMQSGLLRWQAMHDRPADGKPAPEWGESNNHAIEEPWYVGAVLQHQVNNYSFYFSLPPDAERQDPNLLTVTATHAVFHLDESKYVPASVLGYVMPHASLQRRFENVTSKACKTCLPCSSERLDCYLLDSAGYVMASKSSLDTGRFFGEIEGAVMAEMVTAGLFTVRKVYDYQALCYEEVPLDSGAGFLATPLIQLRWLWHWTVGRLAWLLLQSELAEALAGDWLLRDWLSRLIPPGPHGPHGPHGDYRRFGKAKRRVKRKKARPEEELGEVFPRKPPKGAKKTVSFPCERKTELYRLEQEKMRDGNFRLPPPECSRPYSARAVPNSNMLLVVTDPMSSNTCFNRLFASSTVIEYNVTQPCQKMNLNDLPRRRLGGCYNQHPKEKYMRQCGDAGTAVVNVAAVLASISIFVILPRVVG